MNLFFFFIISVFVIGLMILGGWVLGIEVVIIIFMG